MKRTITFWIGIVIVVLLFLAVAGYAYFRAQNYLDGPIITITSPLDDATVTDPDLTITGNVKNAVQVSLDDRSIFLDQAGNFSEKLLLAPGYTIITVKAEDRFGRNADKQIEVVFNNND